MLEHQHPQCTQSVSSCAQALIVPCFMRKILSRIPLAARCQVHAQWLPWRLHGQYTLFSPFLVLVVCKDWPGSRCHSSLQHESMCMQPAQLLGHHCAWLANYSISILLDHNQTVLEAQAGNPVIGWPYARLPQQLL